MSRLTKAKETNKMKEGLQKKQLYNSYNAGEKVPLNRE